ncbi:MAG: hypothetical protein L6R40_000058 [Gallowayella cf. fulva]|nr:MAG: hypothetical protein L6R40_000058 [Xanthomendoza cf. fulva]
MSGSYLLRFPSDDEEDETAELLRELEKIKKERADKQAQEERVKAEAEQEDRERDIALGNPLLNPHKSNETKRRHVSLESRISPLLMDGTGGTTMSFSETKHGARKIRARRNSSMYANEVLHREAGVSD